MAGSHADSSRTSSSGGEQPLVKSPRGIGPHRARATRGRRGGSPASAASNRSPSVMGGVMTGFDVDEASILSGSTRGVGGIPDPVEYRRSCAGAGYVGGSPATADVTKYYAVRVGRTPGIYTSWNECEHQVLKYSGAKHKSFKTRIEAYNWLHGIRDGESLALAAPATQSQGGSDPGARRRDHREQPPSTGPIRRGSHSPRREPEPRIFMKPIADLGRRLVSGIPNLFANGGDPVSAARGRNRSPGASAASEMTANNREIGGSPAPAGQRRALMSGGSPASAASVEMPSVTGGVTTGFDVDQASILSGSTRGGGGIPDPAGQRRSVMSGGVLDSAAQLLPLTSGGSPAPAAQSLPLAEGSAMSLGPSSGGALGPAAPRSPSWNGPTFTGPAVQLTNVIGGDLVFEITMLAARSRRGTVEPQALQFS